MTYIFTQFILRLVIPFKNEVLKWQIKYLEGKDPDLTPTRLLDKADDQVRVLKHANQWIETTADTSVMALQATIDKNHQATAEVFKAIAANIGEFTQRQHDFNSRFSGSRNGQRPTWLNQAPSNPNETKVWNNKTYIWCSRCRRGEGLWVCSHTTDTHQDGFRDASRSDRYDRFRRYDQRQSSNNYYGPTSSNRNSYDSSLNPSTRYQTNRYPSPNRGRSVTFQDRPSSPRPSNGNNNRGPYAKLSLLDAVAAFAGQTAVSSDED